MAKAEEIPLDQAWKNWGDCLTGKDTNSIFQQISLMIWDTAIFRIIVAGRKLQIDKNPQNPEINGALHSFIERNYFLSQCTFIRRLTDKSCGLTGHRGVYSVVALINDILRYKDKLTRETFFKLKNMPYDYTEIQNREREFLKNKTLEIGFFVPPEFNWEPIVEAHQIFDSLSGTTHINRNPNDLIADRLFMSLQEKLAVCQEIITYVDKFIAHSATPESRSISNEATYKISLKRLWEAQRIIFKVAEFLSIILFSEGHMALPLENYNFFEFWDKPLVEKDNIDLVRVSLEEYRKETEKWNDGGIDDVWGWIKEK